MIIAIGWWQFYRPELATPEQNMTATPVNKLPSRPVIQHPVTTTPEELEATAPILDLEQPLPELQQSDLPMADILSKLFADQKLDRFFLLEHFIERFNAGFDTDRAIGDA